MDKYEEALAKATKELKECQEKKELQSCLVCQKCLECQTRTKYVDAVYQSMSKGTTGGFEF